MTATRNRTLLWVFILLLTYVSSAAGASVALTQAGNTDSGAATNPATTDWRYILAGAVLLVGAVWLFFRARRSTP